MDRIDYKPKYKDVAATFKYGKNIGTFLIVMLTLLLLVCVALVVMGIAFIVIDGVDSEYLALLVGVIIVGLCGIGFCAYVYYLVYKRYEEINKWIEDAVFVDGICWFDSDTFDYSGSASVYFKFEYNGKYILKKGIRRKNYKKNQNYYCVPGDLLGSFVMSAILTYYEKNTYSSEMEKYSGKHILLLYSPKYDQLMIPNLERKNDFKKI